MKATIWRVEFCHSNLGVYDYQWFKTEREAEDFVQKQVLYEGYTFTDDSVGHDMTITSPEPIEVEITLDGLLHFANCYAVDTGAC